MRKIPALIVIGSLGAGALGLTVPAGAALDPYRETERLNVGPGGVEANGETSDVVASVDGRWVAFASDATNLVAGDQNDSTDVFVRDLTTGVVTRVSVATDGEAFASTSESPSISGNGRFVSFVSAAELDPADDNGLEDVYVRDRDTDVDGVFDEVGAVATTWMTSDGGAAPETGATGARLSSNGEWIAVVTDWPYVNADQNDGDDVYVRSVLGDETMQRISKGSSPDGGGGDQVTISADGRHVGFRTFSFDIPPHRVSGYYVRDRDADNDGIFDETGTASTVFAVTNPLDGTNIARFTSYAALSEDGRYVSFSANGVDLVPGAVNNSLYVRDRDTDGDGVFDEVGAQSLEIVSKSTDGSVIGIGQRPAFSPNARYLTFDTASAGITAGDEAGLDVVVRDLVSDTTTRRSQRTSGLPASGSNLAAAVDNSGDVIYTSTGTDLVPNDTNGLTDAFRTRLTSAPAFTYTVRMTEDDYAKAKQAAAYFGVPVDRLAQRGTWTLAWIVKAAGGGVTPAAVQPNDGPVVLHTSYSEADNYPTEYVSGEFQLDGDSMHILGLRFMIFVWLLETGQNV